TLVEHEVIAAGAPAEVAAHVATYPAHGVDEVVLNLGGVYLAEGPGAAARDLKTILEAAGALR
ncbi:MAG TPA: hypothetical protein VHO01_05085, partial [Jatrophihabitans sp.]|nr:hypothetical protein [Jatrophihabitans sp.]